MYGGILQTGLVHKGRCIFEIFETDIAKVLLGAGVLYLGESHLSLLGSPLCRSLWFPDGFSKSYVLPQQQRYGT